jgi:hypothetical protein
VEQGVNMHKVLEAVIELHRTDEQVQSIAVSENPSAFPFLVEGCDFLLLLLTSSDIGQNYTTHYIKDGFAIQERWVAPSVLKQALHESEGRSMVHWILQGKVMLDREGFMRELRSMLSEFPHAERERKLFQEFAMLIRRYSNCKGYMQEGHLMDAYTNILAALQHWARVAIIEHGRHPELTVWKQLHEINPGVFKLYEELMLSRETLEQRIQLVLLACEFSVISKMEKCCEFLLRIVGSRSEPWSTKELQEHYQLSDMANQIPLLLEKLARKSLVRQVNVAFPDDPGLKEIRYAR